MLGSTLGASVAIASPIQEIAAALGERSTTECKSSTNGNACTFTCGTGGKATCQNYTDSAGNPTTGCDLSWPGQVGKAITIKGHAC